MSNIIQLKTPSRILPLEARTAALLGTFSTHRRKDGDVFWLKENAELLNILECTGVGAPAQALALHAQFYANAEERLRFFPQYYRFLLSIALDLEDLGMPGNVAERMVHFAAQQELPEAELSDLQRAEARRLLTRRGVTTVREQGLDERLHAFINRSKTFSLPNKKAAYELTHIVFYLSEYGRRDPAISTDAVQSLHFAGLTAFLDLNADLLAEVCIALRYAGETPPEVWTAWLAQETNAFTVEDGDNVSIADDYHQFFVCNWHQAVVGDEVFRKPLTGERTRFNSRPKQGTALREISQALLAMEGERSGDWDVMRTRMEPQLSEGALGLLQAAATSTGAFPEFFEGFARAGRV